MKIYLALMLAATSCASSDDRIPVEPDLRKVEEKQCIKQLKGTDEAKHFCGCFYTNIKKVFGNKWLKDLDGTDKQLVVMLGQYCAVRTAEKFELEDEGT
jgi:hypothetical protein